MDSLHNNNEPPSPLVFSFRLSSFVKSFLSSQSKAITTLPHPLSLGNFTNFMDEVHPDASVLNLIFKYGEPRHIQRCKSLSWDTNNTLDKIPFVSSLPSKGWSISPSETSITITNSNLSSASPIEGSSSNESL